MSIKTLRTAFTPRAALMALALLVGLAGAAFAPRAQAETRITGGVNLQFGGGYRGGYWHHPGWYGPRVGWSVGWGWRGDDWDDWDGYPGWGWYAPPAYAYAPPVIVERQVAPLPPAPPGPAPQASWYYCDSAKAYYPYVSTCPEGWRAVPTTPEK